MSGDALSNIGEIVAAPEKSGSDRRSKCKDRNVLARMVGTLPRRIATVIGGQHGKIRAPQPNLNLGQPAVEFLEGGGIACDIAPVPIERIEIDEVGEDD